MSLRLNESNPLLQTIRQTPTDETDETISDSPGIDGENIDDESDTEITLIIRMLKIEHEYVTQVESKYFHIEIISSKPQQPDNNQKNHTLHI